MEVQAEVLFAIVPEWVLYASISDRAVRLYGVLARYADKSGRAHPGRATLAGHLNCSPDSVDRALKELEALGAVRVLRTWVPGESHNAVNRYELRQSDPSRREAASRSDAAPLTSRSAAGGRTGAASTPNGSPAATGTDAALASRTGAAQTKALEREETLRPAPAARPWSRSETALATVCGKNPENLTPAEGKQLGVKLGEIRKAELSLLQRELEDEELAGEIAIRATRYARRYPGVNVTAPGLAMHWSELGPEPPALRAEPDLTDRFASEPAGVPAPWVEQGISREQWLREQSAVPA